MTNDDLKAIGFLPNKESMLGDVFEFNLFECISILIAYVGTENEKMFMIERYSLDLKQITDSICVSDFRRNGQLTIGKVNAIISALSMQGEKYPQFGSKVTPE